MHMRGGGGRGECDEVGSFFARMSLAIVLLQRESKNGVVTISKCHFLKYVFLDTETSKWFLSVSPMYTLPLSQGMAYDLFSNPVKHLRTLWIIGETGRCMHEQIEEHAWDIRLSRIQSSVVSEHANKTGHYPL